MKYNQIAVTFFSKNVELLDTFAALFSDEVDFSYRGSSDPDELSVFSETQSNSVLLIDLTYEFYQLGLFFDKRNTRLFSLPTIFILANEDSNIDLKKEGFSCFDVVLKPINVNELLLAIRVLLGKSIPSDELSIMIGSNSFTLKKNILKNSQGASIKLTEKENKIISFLYEGRGAVRSKDLILRAIWGYNGSISTHTLETHIYRLRKKLEIGLNEKNLILRSSEGYFLNLL